MLLIFINQKNNRCKYVFDFVLKQQGIPYRLTDNQVEFVEYIGAKFNYSDQSFNGVEQWIPANLLFQEQVVEQSIQVGSFNGEDTFLFDEVLDPLASIFFVITRMEEYYPGITLDNHQRYAAHQSVLVKYDLIEKVMCDRWAKAIVNYLFEKGLVNKEYEPSDVKIHPSFDIDHTYAYLLKNGIRKVGAVVKDYLKRDVERIKERRAVLKGELRDPYDTFDYIAQIAQKYPVNLFWLVGKYHTYDRNCSISDKQHQLLIQRLNQLITLGIHPSYHSNSDFSSLQQEVNDLKRVINKKVEHSRQHFLKLRFPVTYQNLLNLGIEHDYTMGFATHIGFRAGTLKPFKWFDLSKNEVTNLTVHPFAYMDGTLLEYNHYTIEDAKVKVKQLFDEVVEFGGDFYFLWHNETIGDHGKWNGWREVLEFTLNLKK